MISDDRPLFTDNCPFTGIALMEILRAAAMPVIVAGCPRENQVT
jgi:hypothetical protein